LLSAISVWAQKQGPTIVFEKRHGKIMRIEKYKSIEVVSEKSFTIPIYAINEETLFRLEPYMTTYIKNNMLKLVSGFMGRKRKYFDFDKLKYLAVDCYFDKNTLELKEITYRISPESISRHTTLGDLTDEIKTEGNLSINKSFRDRKRVFNADLSKYAAKYYRFSFFIWDRDLKPYLSGKERKNK